jgi:acyl-CoA dehydrogenase
VEGANILTRTLIVFGQGAVRCHPYALKTLHAIEADDVDAFRTSVLGWGGHMLGNIARNALRGWTRGWAAGSPVSGPTAKYYRRLAWASSRYAVLTDLALFGVGGKLKAAGNLTGRFADVLSWLYMGTATLRRFEAEGRREEDLVLVQWALEYMLGKIQEGFDGIYANFPVPVLGGLLRIYGRFWLRINPLGSGVPDYLNAPAARTIQRPGEQYERLMEHVFLPQDSERGLGRLLHAWRLVAAAEPVLGKIRAAQKQKKLPRGRPQELLEQAVSAKLISEEEAEQVRAAEAARLAAIQVDEFTPDEYHRRHRGDAGGGSSKPVRAKPAVRRARPATKAAKPAAAEKPKPAAEPAKKTAATPSANS